MPTARHSLSRQIAANLRSRISPLHPAPNDRMDRPRHKTRSIASEKANPNADKIHKKTQDGRAHRDHRTEFSGRMIIQLFDNLPGSC